MRASHFAVFLVVALPAVAQADSGALSRAFALPQTGQYAVMAPGQSRYALELDLTNEFVSQATPAESLLLDGEAARLSLNYRGGFAPGFDWNFEAPVYLLGGGFMDSFIEGWHDIFGLPNGGRERMPQDQYRFRYQRGGVTLFDLNESGAFLGDISVGAGWQVTSQIAVRGQLKLPTGDGRGLTGGNAGAAFWADARLPFNEDSPWSGSASLGLSFNSDGDVLPAQQQNTVVIGGAELRYTFNDRFSLYSRLSPHSALYDAGSEFEALDSLAVPALFGVSWALAENSVVDIAFQEDLNPGASPDFGLRFSWRQR